MMASIRVRVRVRHRVRLRVRLRVRPRVSAKRCNATFRVRVSVRVMAGGRFRVQGTPEFCACIVPEGSASASHEAVNPLQQLPLGLGLRG